MSIAIVSVAMLSAALASAAPDAAQAPVGSAISPAGPPATTPLNAQGQDILRPRGPDGRAGGSAAATAAPVASGAPAAAGQPATGVITYPASFFAAALPNTAMDMINRLPGFSLVTGGGDRGFSSAGNALIDGERPSSKNDDLGSILQRIPASQVDHIDLIRGGAPGVDMLGQTVMANVVRKKGTSTTGVMSISDTWVTSDGRQAPFLRLEGSRRNGDRLAEISYIGAGFVDDGSGDGTRVRRDGAGHIIDNAIDKTEGDSTQHTLSGSYETPLEGGKLRVNSQATIQEYYSDDDVSPVSPLIPGTVGSRERDHQNREELELGANYTRSFGRDFKLETVLLQTIKGEDYLTLFDTPGESDRFREQHTQGETVGRSTLSWTASPKLTIDAGGEAAYNWLNSHTRFATNGVAEALPGANVDVTELRGEAFAKASVTLSPKLSAELGIRIEVSDIGSSGDVVLDKTLIYPKPRLAVTWSPTKADQFRFRVEEEVGQLDFNDFVASSSLSTGQILAGNPDLVPQQATVFEATWERRFLKDAVAAITFRHSQLADVEDRAPIFSPSGVFDAPANIGDGREEELIATLNLPLDRFGVKGGLIKANATFRDSQVVDPTTGQSRPISGVRPSEGQIKFSQDLPKQKMKWGASIFAGFRQRYYRFNQVETDTFNPVGSLYLEMFPAKGLSLRWELNEIGIDYSRRLTVVDGVRGVDPIAYAETRPLMLGPFAYFRVRKSF